MHGLSLVGPRGGYSLADIHRLLIAVAPAVAEHRLQSAGSEVPTHGLGCPKTCGILPDQGSNPHSLHWQLDSQPLDHQENPIGVLRIRKITVLQPRV